MGIEIKTCFSVTAGFHMCDCHDISILISEDPKVGVGAVIWSTCQSVSSSIVYKTS